MKRAFLKLMYTINILIKGTSALLQHAFGQTQLNVLREAAKKQTGVFDYSMEWLNTMYVTKDGYLYQPATHVEGAIQRAASAFKVKGKGGKTWQDAFKAYVYIRPDEIIHLREGEPVRAPGEELLRKPTEYLSVSMMRVKVQRAAVVRSRLQIAPGWELKFSVRVHDEQVRPEVIKAVLDEAGHAVGIGDYRPRFGRFTVEEFVLAS